MEACTQLIISYLTSRVKELVRSNTPVKNEERAQKDGPHLYAPITVDQPNMQTMVNIIPSKWYIILQQMIMILKGIDLCWLGEINSYIKHFQSFRMVCIVHF